MKLAFTEADSERANADWGANCGPHSLAAALAIDLETVRHLMPDFERKGYTNPTMLKAALDRAGIVYKETKGLKTRDLCEGIVRVQWEGPWLNPGVPKGAAYCYTHLVASVSDHVFCTCTDSEWVPAETWRQFIDRLCLTFPKCTGWHITHHFAFEVLAKEVA